jgi:Icc-related predicted phosphoesterase
LKFVAISDTHGQHNNVILPKGEVLIHAGDVTRRGKEAEAVEFMQWFAKQDFTYKIFIAGNHDFYFERAAFTEIEKNIPGDIIYLNDSGVTINNLHIWGSPITPWFFDWAFNRHRGPGIQRHWQLIPANTSILITHGPVHNILDKTVDGTHAGCEDLLHKVNTIRPAVHVGGHIHEAYGKVNINGTTFINASLLDEEYRMVNAPVWFEL